MTMSKKHFQAIADILGSSYQNNLHKYNDEKLLSSFCDFFKKENPNFNKSTFLKAVDKANKKNNDLVDAHRLLKAENQFHKDCADQYKKQARILQSKVKTYEADIEEANRKKLRSKLRSSNDLDKSKSLW